MTAVRLISQGSTTDVEQFRELVDRMAAHVKEHEKGALGYECFLDADSGRVTWLETHQDEAAFLGHVQELTSSGLMDELMQQYTIERITSLGPVRHEMVKEILGQLDAAILGEEHGFVR